MAQQTETEPVKPEAASQTPPPEGRRRNPESPPPERRPFIREHPVALIVGVILLVGLAIGGIWIWNYMSSYESTDDAQVDSHIYPISPRVGGRVMAVNADANQSVKAGQVLIQLDPTDYKVALQKTKADLAEAQADANAAQTQIPIMTTSTLSQTANAGAGVAEAQATVSVAEQQHVAAQARIREAQANFEKAQKDVERFRPLVEKEEISRQQFDQAVATAAAMGAMVDTARANADAAARQVTQARAHVQQAEAQQAATQNAPQEIAGERARATSSQAKAQSELTNVQQAELMLQYTRILSPIDGVVGRRSVEVGQQVQAGQELMAVVALNDLWITANFKETQMKNMRVGQPATVHVDAVDHEYKAHIDSFPGATGARFSLLPPENATGNYVKVVQRLPVKIVFDAGQDSNHTLRPGMSVDAKVWIK